MAISPDNLERLGPRLRVVCNGDAEVNGLRAELSAAVEATPTLARQLAARERLQQAVRKPDTGRTLPTPPSRQPSTDAVKVSCFVRLAGAEATRPRLPGKTIQRGDLVTAQLSPRELETIVNRGPAERDRLHRNGRAACRASSGRHPASRRRPSDARAQPRAARTTADRPHRHHRRRWIRLRARGLSR